MRETSQQYAEKHSPGQLALLKQIRNYRMDVDSAHRDCSYLGWIQDNTHKNAAGAAKLDASGNYLSSATLPGLPFPETKNGQKAIWNYLMRYRGVGVQWKTWRCMRPVSSSNCVLLQRAAYPSLFGSP